MKRTYLTREQILDRIKTLPRNPKYLTKEQIERRIQKLANPPKRPKSDL